jgi:hypothetical protein
LKSGWIHHCPDMFPKDVTRRGTYLVILLILLSILYIPENDVVSVEICWNNYELNLISLTSIVTDCTVIINFTIFILFTDVVSVVKSPRVRRAWRETKVVTISFSRNISWKYISRWKHQDINGATILKRKLRKSFGSWKTDSGNLGKNMMAVFWLKKCI